MTTYPTFPTFPGLEYPVKRSPRLASIRQNAISGRETFQPLWTAPIWDYEISFSVLNASAATRGGSGALEYQQMIGFWNTTMTTPGGVFQYNDPEDNTATAQEFAAGDGATTQFQLMRSFGGFAEPVLNPAAPTPNTPGIDLDYGNCTVAPGPTLDYGNCTVSPSADLDYGYASQGFIVLESSAGPEPTVLAPYALSPGGILTMSYAPGNGAALTWTGTYTWLCRFSGGGASGMTATQDTLSTEQFMYQLHDIKSVKFSTIHL